MAQWYRQALLTLVNKEADWNSDTIKITLHTSSYTPNRDTHVYVSDLTNEVTGPGYSAGGATLASCTQTYTAANSWGTQWAGSTAYTADWIVRPTVANGLVYRCAVAGTSSSSQPTWPTVVGREVTDGTAVWVCAGSGVLALDAADPSWTSSTITARYAVISDRTPGAAASQPLLGLIDFTADKSSSAGPFTITFSTQGVLLAVI
jgi:hypothetical protein